MASATATGTSALLTILVSGVFLGYAWVERSLAFTLPTVPSIDIVLFDETPVPITITVLWQKLPRVVTTHQLHTDRTIWQQMHVGDWDKIGNPTRDRALSSMLRHYRHILDSPEGWSALTVYDWDLVPQPIRAFAFQRMIEHWTSFYDVGAGYAESHRLVADTVSAIVMAESWFEHRAFTENPWGNRDYGLAGCSNHCRRVLAEMAEEGRVDFLLEDDEYFDPRNGTRAAAIWFGRELVRAEGDMDLAIAAYYRGLDAARRGKGREYVANVHRLRERYIRAQNPPSPAWAFLFAELPGGSPATNHQPPTTNHQPLPIAASPLHPPPVHPARP
jgi:hypothetical protein